MRIGMKTMLPHSYGELELAMDGYGELELAMDGMGAVSSSFTRPDRRLRRGTGLKLSERIAVPGSPAASSSAVPGMVPGSARVLGPAPAPRGMVRPRPRYTLRRRTIPSVVSPRFRAPTVTIRRPAPVYQSSSSVPQTSSAYRRTGPAAPVYNPYTAASTWYQQATPGYFPAYPAPQSYMPSFSAQQYMPIGPGAPLRRRRLGRRLRRLRKLLLQARRKGFKHWRVRNRRGKWVSRVTRRAQPRRRSRLARKIQRTRRRLRVRYGKGRQVKRLVRAIMGPPRTSNAPPPPPRRGRRRGAPPPPPSSTAGFGGHQAPYYDALAAMAVPGVF